MHVPPDRTRMVEDQLRRRDIVDERVLAAMERVPRELFVPLDLRGRAFDDAALPIGVGQTISQPYMVARILEELGLDGDERVLDVGTGSGYQAAILSELGADVTSIERHESLATEAKERLRSAGYTDVKVVVGDGTAGWSAGAPYRSILVTAAGPAVPRPLIDQLHPDGGRLVMPVGGREHQFLTLVERDGDEIQSGQLEPVVFVPLIGRYGVREG